MGSDGRARVLDIHDLSEVAQAASPLSNTAMAIAVNLDMDHRLSRRANKTVKTRTAALAWGRLNDSDSDHIATISLRRKNESADTDIRATKGRGPKSYAIASGDVIAPSRLTAPR